MCLSPLQIINPTKYVLLHHRDRYLMQVPCGHCAECQKQRSNEWYYRTYWHALEVFNKYPNSFVLFDTLTYSPSNLPMMSQFMPVGNSDFPCFNPKHLRNFVTSLRIDIQRKYNSNFSYFITSEYGTSERHTHRPHYHALFFVNGSITPSQFSLMVSKHWKYGRTDGLPYRSEAYVRHNTFDDMSADNLRCCRYVAKYVQKSCTFQREINRRINEAMLSIASKMPDENWIDSVNAQRVKQKLKRLCNQFHRQSTQFGAYALECLDLANLWETGSLFMPDSKSVVLPIGLPTYYKRKLFYRTIEIDGNTAWIPTDDGEKWLAYREALNLKQLAGRLAANVTAIGVRYDPNELANYVLNERGRIKADNPPSSLLERVEHTSLFNYVTLSDKEHLGHRGLSKRFLGNNTIGYRDSHIRNRILISEFVDKMCYFNPAYEKALNEIASHTNKVDAWKQSAYELRQHLTNLYHYLTT